MSEAQEALDHRNISTTRHYVRSIPTKKDKFSRYVIEAFDLPDADPSDDEQDNREAAGNLRKMKAETEP